MAIDLRAYAKALRNAEGFQEIVRLLKAETIKDWANTDPTDTAKREAHYADIQAIGRLETRLQALENDGVLADRKERAAQLKRGQVTTGDTW